MIALLYASGALAAGYSTDIELIRPTFSHGVLPGFDNASFMSPGTVRGGLVMQYERDPLVLYSGAVEQGAVVSDRLHASLGASVDLTKRVSARLVVPFGGQWGSEVPTLAGDGFAMGDISLGGRVRFLDTKVISTALRVDATLPLGGQDMWFGEKSLRAMGGLVAELKLGPARVIGDVGFIGRQNVDTGEDFTLGSELHLGGNAMLDVWPEHVSVGAGVVSRAGFPNLYGGGAENPAELVAGGQFRTNGPWQIDVGFGRGIADGYGTTQFRGYGGLTYVHVKQPKVPKLAPVVAYVPSVEPTDEELFIEAVPEEPEWKPEELARVEEKQIIIRDPIQFEFATSNILPISQPTLKAIAKLMEENPEIAALVVEGHASDEGSYEYNYDLSVRRSLAIFQALVSVGVNPQRVSIRGMGEVEPIDLGSSEEQLAKNRRVMFHIVKRLRAGEETPPMKAEGSYPWNGAAAKYDVAKAPAPPPPPEDPKQKKPGKPDETDPDQFKEDEE